MDEEQVAKLFKVLANISPWAAVLMLFQLFVSERAASRKTMQMGLAGKPCLIYRSTHATHPDNQWKNYRAFIKRVQRGKVRKYMIVEKYAFALFADQVQILAQSRDTLEETAIGIVVSNHLRP